MPPLPDSAETSQYFGYVGVYGLRAPLRGPGMTAGYNRPPSTEST